MCLVKNRFNLKQLHIAILDKKAFLYDVPTNTVYKVSPVIATKIQEMRCSSNETNAFLETYFNEKLESKEITVPSHSYWGETKALSKLTINVTTRCNLRCKYCYADFGTYSGYSELNMKPEDAVRYIDNLVVNTGINKVNMVQFFGGEPLLAIDTVETICGHFEQLYKDKKIFSLPVFTMITNLVKYNEKVLSVMSKYKIRLTVSIDGPKEIHDLQRVFLSGKGSADIIFRNASILKDYIVAIEATYTRNHILANISKNDLINYLSDKFTIDKGKIFVVPVVGDTNLEVDVNKYLEFLKDDLLNIEDNQALVACDPSMQSDLFCTTGYTTACIMPNGDLYPCHMYATNKSFCIGNMDNVPNTIFIKEKLDELLSINRKENYECGECWARKICHFCPANLLISGEKNVRIVNDDICQSRRERYESILLKSIKD